MSTIAERPSRISASDAPQLFNALAWLRTTIRLYALLEGLALAVVFAALWFWATFLFDWGLLFKILGLDYVRDGTPTARGILRGILLLPLAWGLGSVLLFKLLNRLFVTLNEPALALVIERRFPQVLGDRLVTAVQLAGPHVAQRYGYSQDMIDVTRDTAVDRLRDLPLNKIFNWSHLAWCIVGAVLLASSIGAFAVLETDSTAIWLQRNVLLREVHWPQRTMIELTDFPANGVKAVPQTGELKLNVRALQWVVADHDTPTGWRPLLLDHIRTSSPGYDGPFEPESLQMFEGLFGNLPDGWERLPVDRIEQFLLTLQNNSGTAEAQVVLDQLGRGTLRIISQRLEAKPSEGTALDANLQQILPAAWQKLSGSQLAEHLIVAEKLSAEKTGPILQRLHGSHLLPSDAVQWSLLGLSRIKPLGLSATAIHELWERHHPGFAARSLGSVSMASWWLELPRRDLISRLEEFRANETPISLGKIRVREMLKLFDELDRRSAEKPIARRRLFRRLNVPEEITVEFEQLLTDEERGRTKPKIGKPGVRRIPDTLDFAYDFKKIERPIRFRVAAGDTVTPWKRIDVVPLPVLKKLVRTQEEPGYLYAGNAPVQAGPFAVPLEGEESRFEAPSGARIRLDGESSKKLRSIKLSRNGTDKESTADHTTVGSVVHPKGDAQFQIALAPLSRDELRLNLEFEDTDGIQGVRKVVIMPILDRPPEFVFANFEVVRREMITPNAVVPFSGRIRDDHGLRDLAYEVRLSSMEGKTLHIRRLPFRQFWPLRYAANRADGFKGLTFARLNTDARWLQNWSQSFLSRMPMSGPIGLYQSPSLEIPNEHAFEFPLRQPTEPVFSPTQDEFLDNQMVRRLIEAEGPKTPLPVPPYRLSVQIVAKDNYSHADDKGRPVDGQEARNPESFEFQVIEADDLVIEAGRREEDLRERFEGVIKNLKKTRTQLQRLREDFAAIQSADDFRRVTADCKEASEAIRDGRDVTEREVSREFRLIYRELVLNRCQNDALVHVDKVCRALEETLRTGKHFALAEETVGVLASRVEAEKAQTPATVLLNAHQQTDRLVVRLEEILQEMKKLQEFNELLAILRGLIKGQEDINKFLQEMKKKIEEDELGGSPNP